MVAGQPGLPRGLVGEAQHGKVIARHAVSQPRGADGRVAAGPEVVSCKSANDLRDTAGMAQPELSRNRRMLVLAICCMSLFIVGMDATIVNVALPSIQRDLHAPVSGLQWTVDAYTLVRGQLPDAVRLHRGPVRAAADLPDRPGLFTLGSLLCSLAPGLGWLVAFRMLQALGGSMLNPVAMSIITNTFTDRAERARAIGVWGGVCGHQPGARPDRRGCAGHVGRLAGDLLGQHPGRDRRDHAHRAVRARVQGAPGTPPGSGRPAAGHHDAGLPDLRDHRGPRRSAGPRRRSSACFALLPWSR